MRTNLIAGFTMLTAIFSAEMMPSIAGETPTDGDYCDATITATDGYANLRAAPKVNAKIIRTIRTGKKIRIVAETQVSGKLWYRTIEGLYLRSNQTKGLDCGVY